MYNLILLNIENMFLNTISIDPLKFSQTYQKLCYTFNY
jgi:hypothetical protein